MNRAGCTMAIAELVEKIRSADPIELEALMAYDREMLDQYPGGIVRPAVDAECPACGCASGFAITYVTEIGPGFRMRTFEILNEDPFSPGERCDFVQRLSELRAVVRAENRQFAGDA
jgi:hypothetical protein